jgi:hypothetical protein
LHHNEGELKEAEACYRRALHYRPSLALAHFNLAIVLEDQHDKWSLSRLRGSPESGPDVSRRALAPGQPV